MRRTLIYVILAVIAVAAVVGYFVVRPRLTAQPAEALRSVTVERGTMLVAISASGSIEPEARVNLSFEILGRVVEVPVKVGDAVKAGDVLAQLEPTDLEGAVQQAEINLQTAQLQLEKLQQPPDEADVEVARAAVSDAAAAYETAQMNLTITEHGISVGDEVRAARFARDETYRTYQDLMARLGENSSFTAAAHDAYLNALGQYNRAVENADLQMTTAQNGVTQAAHALQQAQDNRDRLLAGADELDIETAQLSIDTAKLNLKTAQDSLEKATLRAPFDGIVATVNATTGEMASTGLPAITLLDASRFHIHVSVDEMDIGQIVAGQQVGVTLDALPDVDIPGVVESISPAARFDAGVVYYDVVVALQPTDAAIRADMSANAIIRVQELTDVLQIPTWVVRVDGDTGQTYVHRQTASGIERVDVTLGVRYGGVAEVLAGLNKGDTLVWVQESIFTMMQQQ